MDDVNVEGGTGYAGHDNWRIPNRRELESLVDAELARPSIDPIFGPTVPSGYWSSTTDGADIPSDAWDVLFSSGFVGAIDKSKFLFVRAVRGGPK